ncbi:hypothetical protein TNCV_3413231 [Trichonephila clavipes]|uniref:Reverse transcriptase domain-containing protein n=1 Tax=Trichonephila clavipes TaxID=2585209 RepID=A0A8X6UV63_TRICX|nr:hypothetical protein TNCV_3413231 [Trichonephila clavipes]
MEEIVEKVSAAPYVTVMDLLKGYFQIPLTPRAQRYAAFVTPFGTYIPKKMMFRLVCAPYYFCKLMAQVLEGLEQFALPYIDDIAIFSQGWKDHVKHIDIVLGRLRKAGLKVKPSKCKFAQEEVLFLGHRIGSGSRSPSDLKDNTRLSFGCTCQLGFIIAYLASGLWVPVRLDKQLSDHSTVDEIASGAADCRLTYTMANCPQRR